VPTATATPGAKASGAAVSVTTVPGANVAAGTVTVTNTTSAAEILHSVTVMPSRPGIFSSLTLAGAGQSVTVTNVTSNTVFNFSPINLAAGASLTFSLKAAISPSLAATKVGIMYAGVASGIGSNGDGEMAIFGALLLVGGVLIGMPAGRRRRIVLAVIAAIALTAAQSGCGGGGGNHPIAFSSSQEVSAVTATFASGGAVTVSGLPAQLGTVLVL
jgi:hypothetical protein